MQNANKAKLSEMQRLLKIMAQLRDPQSGCPWDVKQTMESLTRYTIEEAYEVADAIATGDMHDIKDELGDLLFQVVFYAQIASESRAFSFDDVAKSISDKLVRRHPHNAQQQGIENVEWLHLDLADKTNVEASLQLGFDKVLLDPSREGALTVCHALVKALPKTIVYVSCNPSTFSRDAKVLIDGGYEMEKAGVAEMFPFTHHMEMMALFTRKQQ